MQAQKSRTGALPGTAFVSVVQFSAYTIMYNYPPRKLLTNSKLY